MSDHMDSELMRWATKTIRAFWGRRANGRDDEVNAAAQALSDKTIREVYSECFSGVMTTENRQEAESIATSWLRDQYHESMAESAAAADFEYQSYGDDYDYIHDDECDHGYSDEYVNRLRD